MAAVTQRSPDGPGWPSSQLSGTIYPRNEAAISVALREALMGTLHLRAYLLHWTAECPEGSNLEGARLRDLKKDRFARPSPADPISLTTHPE